MAILREASERGTHLHVYARPPPGLTLLRLISEFELEPLWQLYSGQTCSVEAQMRTPAGTDVGTAHAGLRLVLHACADRVLYICRHVTCGPSKCPCSRGYG